MTNQPRILSESEIQEIEERAKKCPNGPYEMKIYPHFECPQGSLGRIDACESIGELMLHSRTDIPALIASHRALEAERDELKSLHEQACKFVLPGECDTSDAYRKMLRDAQAERDKWKDEYENLCKFATQFEQQRDAARAALADAIGALEETRGWLTGELGDFGSDTLSALETVTEALARLRKDRA